jgi:hypothetical protein
MVPVSVVHHQQRQRRNNDCEQQNRMKVQPTTGSSGQLIIEGDSATATSKMGTELTGAGNRVACNDDCGVRLLEAIPAKHESRHGIKNQAP